MLKKKTRLNADDWLQTGFDALVELGPKALKAEPLARRIGGATKGSFYWHFRDLPDFHTRLLAKWEERTLLALAAAGEEEADAVKRLERLGTLNGEDPPAEQAIRAWGGRKTRPWPRPSRASMGTAAPCCRSPWTSWA